MRCGAAASTVAAAHRSLRVGSESTHVGGGGGGRAILPPVNPSAASIPTTSEALMAPVVEKSQEGLKGNSVMSAIDPALIDLSAPAEGKTEVNDITIELGGAYAVSLGMASFSSAGRSGVYEALTFSRRDKKNPNKTIAMSFPARLLSSTVIAMDHIYEKSVGQNISYEEFMANKTAFQVEGKEKTFSLEGWNGVFLPELQFKLDTHFFMTSGMVPTAAKIATGFEAVSFVKSPSKPGKKNFNLSIPAKYMHNLRVSLKAILAISLAKHS